MGNFHGGKMFMRKNRLGGGARLSLLLLYARNQARKRNIYYSRTNMVLFSV